MSDTSALHTEDTLSCDPENSAHLADFLDITTRLRVTNPDIVGFFRRFRESPGWIPDLNVPLMHATRRLIGADPLGWEQNFWRSINPATCRTTMCFAGHAVTLAGLTWKGAPVPHGLAGPVCSAVFGRWSLQFNDVEHVSIVVETHQGRFKVQDAAQALLGLTPKEVEKLFYSTPRKVDELDHILDAILARAA